MAVLKKKFTIYGEPYDSILYNYINGIKFPSESEEKLLLKITTIINPPIYRGTEYYNPQDLQINDIINYKRFFSWTKKFSVAKSAAGEDGIILCLTQDNVIGIDLSNVNQLQREVLIAPIQLVIKDIKENLVYVDKINKIHLSI